MITIISRFFPRQSAASAEIVFKYLAAPDEDLIVCKSKEQHSFRHFTCWGACDPPAKMNIEYFDTEKYNS